MRTASTTSDALLSERVLQEIAEHEAIVLEAYRDSVGEWTWGVGVTSASGHRVFPRYRGKPSTIERCLEIFEWLLRTKYLPEVHAAFKGRALKEHELAAALSFHWNTGGIAEASWVKSWLAGDIERARREFLNWSKPREIIGRRKAERSLFFDAVWAGDGWVTQYERVSPGREATPVWRSARQIDIRPALRAVLAKARREA